MALMPKKVYSLSEGPPFGKERVVAQLDVSDEDNAQGDEERNDDKEADVSTNDQKPPTDTSFDVGATPLPSIILFADAGNGG